MQPHEHKPQAFRRLGSARCGLKLCDKGLRVPKASRTASATIVNPKQVEAGLRTNSAGIPKYMTPKDCGYWFSNFWASTKVPGSAERSEPVGRMVAVLGQGPSGDRTLHRKGNRIPEYQPLKSMAHEFKGSTAQSRTTTLSDLGLCYFNS